MADQDVEQPDSSTGGSVARADTRQNGWADDSRNYRGWLGVTPTERLALTVMRVFGWTSLGIGVLGGLILFALGMAGIVSGGGSYYGGINIFFGWLNLLWAMVIFVEGVGAWAFSILFSSAVDSLVMIRNGVGRR